VDLGVARLLGGAEQVVLVEVEHRIGVGRLQARIQRSHLPGQVRDRSDVVAAEPPITASPGGERVITTSTMTNSPSAYSPPVRTTWPHTGTLDPLM
jgi:hypothetical protein